MNAICFEGDESCIFKSHRRKCQWMLLPLDAHADIRGRLQPNAVLLPGPFHILMGHLHLKGDSPFLRDFEGLKAFHQLDLPHWKTTWTSWRSHSNSWEIASGLPKYIASSHRYSICQLKNHLCKKKNKNKISVPDHTASMAALKWMLSAEKNRSHKYCRALFPASSPRNHPLSRPEIN